MVDFSEMFSEFFSFSPTGTSKAVILATFCTQFQIGNIVSIFKRKFKKYLLYLPNFRAIQYKLGPERLTRLGNSNVLRLPL